MKILTVFWLVLLMALTYAQEPFKPSERDKQQIQSKLKALAAAVSSLRAAKVDDDLLVDVEVCQRAVENILRFPEEFFDQQHVINTLTTLDRGLDRAQQLKDGKHGWAQQKGLVTRAYRSRVDATPQPYRVVVPDSYDGSKPMPLYVYLHGRGETDFEVNWLATTERSPDRSLNYIQLFAFGRSFNGFHWAGETDVFEAIASARKRYNIDPDRIVLRGFSMGGTGAWHIGLHHPGEFAALDAEGGNTNSRRHAFLARIPAVAQAAMPIYENMADYALNIFNLPTVGYGGEMDPELDASVKVREQLERERFPFNHQGNMWKARDLQALFLVGPKTGHTMAPADIRRQIDAFLADAANRGRAEPDHIRFVTYTTRYGRSFWVTVAGLQQQYQRAEVDARAEDGVYTIKTKNVSRLLLSDLQRPKKISIDGDTFPLRPGRGVLLENITGHWRPGRPDSEQLTKRHGLQGPIDDAFMDSFLCVRPTGQSLNPVADEYARKEYERFAIVFAKYFRGDARVKDDTAVTAADIAANNIILFGDPGSNKFLARIIAKLPIRWTKESLVIGDRTYSAADHAPALIYPNPLNPRRYVVINSGQTADLRDYSRGDYQLPRYGDYAVFKLNRQASGDIASEVAESGLFDEAWKLPAH